MNKKIKGATPVDYDGIHFRSKIEGRCYTLLKESGLEFEYESITYIIQPSHRLNKITFYAPKTTKGKRSKNIFNLSNSVLHAIKYTPDFIVKKDNKVFIIEVKGKENDTYPLRRKLFLKYLDTLNDGVEYYFFEPHSIYMMKEIINEIKKL